MNYSLYLFGSNKGEFIQYPYDGEEAFLRSLCNTVKGTKLTVYRKDALTHYAFIRQLHSDSSQVFGICLVTNGAYINDIKILYNTFDKIFSHLVFTGKILRLTSSGIISFVSDNFSLDKTSVEQSQMYIKSAIKEDLHGYCSQTRQNFSGLIATKSLSLDERNSEILKAIEQNNVVHVLPNETTNSSINYVEQTISNLYNENSQLKKNTVSFSLRKNNTAM